MLHLFYVYSGIVARLVPQIIERQQLDPADILIVNDRSQTTSTAAGLRSENAGFRPLLNRWRTLPQDWATIRHNSRRIDALTNGRPYIAYLPSPSDPPGQQLLWHPLCKQYWLVEEGLGSYCPPGVSPVHEKPITLCQRIQIGLRLRFIGRIKPVFTDYPHWPSKYAGCFGTNALTFPDFPSPVINLDYPIYQSVTTPITRLVIFDDLSVFNPKLQAIYLDVIRQLISAEHTTGDHWAYKLHPRCAAWPALLAETQRIFDETLPSGTPCEALSPDTSAEDLGLCTTVTTYGYMSSCLFYIHQCGGQVVSLKILLEARDPAFGQSWLRFFPPVLEPLVGGYRMIDDTYH